MIETWLNLFGLLSGAFLLIDFQLQAPALHGDSHEKWIKETGLDISAGSRAEDNGPQENPRRPNCQEVETDRRRHAPKSVQYGIVTRLALTTRSFRIFFATKPRLARGFFSIKRRCFGGYGAARRRARKWHWPLVQLPSSCAPQSSPARRRAPAPRPPQTRPRARRR